MTEKVKKKKAKEKQKKKKRKRGKTTNTKRKKKIDGENMRTRKGRIKKLGTQSNGDEQESRR